jgi:hypothetical protein
MLSLYGTIVNQFWLMLGINGIDVTLAPEEREEAHGALRRLFAGRPLDR